MSESNFNQHCETLLAEYKRRNAEAVAKRLEKICGLLRNDGYNTVQTLLGGSVKKGTFVSGLSDVDVLLIVNKTPFVNQPPATVLKHVQKIVKGRFPENLVSAGKLAVTVNYADGMEIQLLPAIRTKSDGVRIAEHGSSKWSNIVIPNNFTEKLTEINNANGGRVVPVIKLAKAMADCFITSQSNKISGYHMESLAVDAFSDYKGSTDTKSMLIHFLGYSMSAVLSPTPDTTGQTAHVDEYLGDARSGTRERTRTYFGQMRGNVKRCETRAEFNELFCLDN